MIGDLDLQIVIWTYRGAEGWYFSGSFLLDLLRSSGIRREVLLWGTIITFGRRLSEGNIFSLYRVLALLVYFWHEIMVLLMTLSPIAPDCGPSSSLGLIVEWLQVKHGSIRLELALLLAFQSGLGNWFKLVILSLWKSLANHVKFGLISTSSISLKTYPSTTDPNDLSWTDVIRFRGINYWVESLT